MRTEEFGSRAELEAYLRSHPGVRVLHTAWTSRVVVHENRPMPRHRLLATLHEDPGAAPVGPGPERPFIAKGIPLDPKRATGLGRI